MTWLNNLDVVNKLLVSIIAVSFLGFALRKWTTPALALIPQRTLRVFSVHRLFTHAWLHTNVGHLLGNCLGLYFAGHILHSHLGSDRTFLLLFAFVLIAGAAMYALLFFARNVAVIGVSGAVYGIISSAVFLAPNSDIKFLMYMIPSYVCVPLFVLLSIGREIRNKDGIAHGLHLTGAFAGFIAAYWYDPGTVKQTAQAIFSPSVRLFVWLVS